MTTSFQPFGVTETASVFDNLLVHGPYQLVSVTIDQNAGASGADTDIYAPRGCLLAIDPADSKAEPAAAAETTVAIAATAEVIYNNLQATGPLTLAAQLANPPIPGTVQIAVTADGSATVVDNLGVDDGLGFGTNTGGSYIINYQNGAVIATLAAAPTDTEDLKAGYKHRGLPAMPSLVLAEAVTVGAIKAGDVIRPAYVKGTFHQPNVRGFSEGYRLHLKTLGLHFAPAANLLA